VTLRSDKGHVVSEQVGMLRNTLNYGTRVGVSGGECVPAPVSRTWEVLPEALITLPKSTNSSNVEGTLVMLACHC